MNLIDIAVIGVLALFILHGIYKGFLPTLLSIGAYILAWLAAIVLLPVGSNSIRGSEKLFNTMLYYTEGSEYVNDVELARKSIDEISTDTLNAVFAKADLPYPMAKNIADNIARESFAENGITTLGDYFNQTIVIVFINILVFIAMFAIIRIILAFIINGVDYAWTLPKLRVADRAIAGGIGLIRGILAVFLLFMLLPIVLIVLQGKFAFLTDMVNDSMMAKFFYRTNFLLSMMPGR
ncbi:MAG: CvpA family protein [Eubacteriales bacterium]|nr:CvpA family protein [Eubacteriales bacterium]MCI6979805.1 CvpA family protein [Clostridiales bacterium]MDD6720789.1 CvpA family protein [Clostridiales bacterium]MDY5694469.1 CvpA family protein [Eubacteriales bacterium]HZK45200.1 CvpA family protein [Clostridia bacterium]